MSWATIDLREVLWTLAALPGFYLWSRNAIYANKTLEIVKRLGIDGGPRVWAQFSSLLTRSFIGLEFVFVVIGVNAMTRPQPIDYDPWLSWTIGILLILASVLISFLGYRWKKVDDYLTRN